ncbi:RNA polymerase sigma factor [Chitinophaga sp. XS-30]|uniref:RNA polymerase sigma factor n=1 Tax=Chitinophaga sp. XS-30 TaxID=2604421 RepID=UPI0011DD26A9|nr:sigma-70 family RNA polymerase sigma factor [Chitinophaga sp. XS-30]QEH40855.1 sigma-70 family RNA polymerase sigma factor [Chitinophaga sp. XS-30]
MTNLDIRHLWHGLLQGDESLLYRLHNTLYTGILAYGLKFSSDRELVKDAINQTFLYLWQKRDSLPDAQSPQAYIFTAFKRRLIGMLENRQADPSSSGWPDTCDEPAETSHEQELVHRDDTFRLQEAVSAAIALLPPRKQQLIRLKYLEGLSYREITVRTGLSERTIYNKLHEAIKTLRAQLAGTDTPYPSVLTAQLALR